MLTSDPRFVPPHCPRATCVHHADPKGWRFIGHGTHSRKAPPHVVRRFKCMSCRHTFSTQSFDTTYWLKRPDLQRPLLESLVSCVAYRQLGRAHGVAASTLQRQASRLGRHCMLFQQLHAPQHPPNEAIVIDGLVSFEYSQFWPFEINSAVGASSHFVYGFLDAELRRSGRMTDKQKARREELEKAHGTPAPNATEESIEKLLRMVARSASKLSVISDEHAAYPRAMRKLDCEIEHRAVSSRLARTPSNPLHPVNLLDLLVRHCSSNNKRKTIAFSKRRQGSLERTAVFQVWRNWEKRRSEQKPDSPTPAMALGIASAPLGPADILSRRLFPSLVSLPEPMRDIYQRRIPTRQMARCTRHELKLAA